MQCTNRPAAPMEPIMSSYLPGGPIFHVYSNLDILEQCPYTGLIQVVSEALIEGVDC